MDSKICGRIYDIQGFSVHDGPGIRTTVFLKGCPLTCLWCHSPESQLSEFKLSWFEMRCVGIEKCGLCLVKCKQGALSIAKPQKALLENSTITKVSVDWSKCTQCLECTTVCPAKALMPSGYIQTVEEVFDRINKDRAFYETSGGGVTISGGEPMDQFEFTYALAKRCKEAGITVCLDTCGYANGEQYEQIVPYIDLFLFDLKHMNTKKSLSFVGVNNELILENAKRIAAAGGYFQIRIPIIPKVNEDEENLRKTAEFCQELGEGVKVVQLLPYHRMGITKYERIGEKYKLTNVETPTDEFMNECLILMKSYGLSAKIN